MTLYCLIENRFDSSATCYLERNPCLSKNLIGYTELFCLNEFGNTLRSLFRRYLIARIPWNRGLAE